MSKTGDRFKARAAQLKTELTVVYYAYRDPRTPALPKALILLTLAYALSPIDLIPDFIPVLGYLDDIVIIPALISLSLRKMPKEILEDAREKANKEPLTLRKNWFMAAVFVLIWIIVLVVVIEAIVSLI